MGRLRPRFNEKARASGLAKRRKDHGTSSRSSWKKVKQNAPAHMASGIQNGKADVDLEGRRGDGEAQHHQDGQEDNEDRGEGDNVNYQGTDTAVPLIIDEKEAKRKKAELLASLPEQPEGKISSKKRKRLEKFIERQLKKEERVELINKLSANTFSSDLLQSSKSLGGKATAKERLRRALKEERSGLKASDPKTRLHVGRNEAGEEDWEEVIEEVQHRDADEEEEEEDEVKGNGRAKGKEGKKRKDREEVGDEVEVKAPVDCQQPKKRKGEEDEEEDAAKAKSTEGLASRTKPRPEPTVVVPTEFGSGLRKQRSAANLPNDAQPGSQAAAALQGNEEPIFGGALKKGPTGQGPAEIMVRKRQRKSKEGLQPKKQEFASFYSDDEDSADGETNVDDNKGSEAGGSGGDDDNDDSGQEPRLALPKKPIWTTDVAKGESFPGTKPSKTAVPQPAPPKPKPAPRSIQRSYHVPVTRPPHITLARVHLPVVGEEQPIMEAVGTHDCVILCGETGSGKTTQVPQFLYEAGFGDPKHPRFPGLIGCTQPRRVAAISVAKRVAEEMGVSKGEVAYQVRYDASTVKPSTRIKFMTDGILLRELSGATGQVVSGTGEEKAVGSGKGSGDLLLSKYSCIIIDEAHERTVGTDVLIGWLTRIVALRNSGRIAGLGPLKLIIMSATLRVEDFTMNRTLFPKEVAPPVVKVDGRQYKVVVHYNRVTPEVDYVTEAIKKISKIHTKLPHGGILVFLAGQSEITAVVRKLRKAFPLAGAKGKEGEAGNSMAEKTRQKVDAAGLFGDIDDQDGVPVGYEDGLDDYDLGEAEEDDEEEEVEVLDGAEGDEDEENAVLPDKNKPWPLHVLPLYSLLPTAAQMRVFEAPPPGTRLCVVATNVAETSLTIPGIRYVVDCGKVKERRFESQTSIQTFQIGWTSRASADQRAGRAGRVGPGHCYRLFSSAVFQNHFEEFSKPEILRVPVEGVILQMKSMGIDSVVNFPFPTPPGRSALRSGERLLVNLGAVEPSGGERVQKEGLGRITELGRILAKFPISPRYAKMLVIASNQSRNILNYMIAIVAGLSVGEPFVRDEDVAGRADQDDDEEAYEEGDTKERRQKMRGEWHRVMEVFAGPSPRSDALKVLRAIGAYSVAVSGHREAAEDFCKSHFLRPKAMEEIDRLRNQLHSLVAATIPADGAASDPIPPHANLPPPTPEQCAMIRQILLAGYPDQVARLDIVATKAQRGVKNAAPLYATMWGVAGESFRIHNASCLMRQRPPPEWIVYEEVLGARERLTADNEGVVQTRLVVSEDKAERRLYLKNVTAISEKWIAAVAPSTLLKNGKLMEQPEPRYDGSRDEVVGFAAPNFGPKIWELPVRQFALTGVDGAMYFAKALLEGDVVLVKAPKIKRKRGLKGAESTKNLFQIMLSSSQPYLNSKPAIITKHWARVQSKVSSILTALAAAKVFRREDLIQKWRQNKRFLLDEYMLWLPQNLQIIVHSFWPPVEIVEDPLMMGPPTVTERIGMAQKLETLIAATGHKVGQRPDYAQTKGGSDADSDY
ncbi:ATP-dependent RNA helicase dhx37 [Irineochytrium annulatum]|nr:ATP-dependent RNA helicase dhx37 [Irineochytrium annulatum]